MKKYVSAFRIFFGRCNFSSMAAFLGVMGAMVVIVGVLEILASGGDFTSGMAAGMSIMLAGVVPCAGMIFINSLYTYANPATPGHKYFISLPDSAEQFRRAVIAANVFSMALGLVLLAVMYGVFTLLRLDASMSLFGLLLLLLEVGMCNFAGYIRNLGARVAVIVPVMCGTGFAAGFLSSDDDNAFSFGTLYEQKPWLVFILFGAALLLFAAGLVYSVAVCRRKWVRE